MFRSHIYTHVYSYSYRNRCTLVYTYSHEYIHTQSYGNVSVGQATENVAKLLHETKRTDVPFHVGASSPLFGPTTTASYAHGTDGYGDTGLPAAPSHVQPSDKPAAHAIVDLLTKEPGKHTLVLLGPHTNLAHALALEPELHTYAKKLIFLGGNTTGLGNITAAVSEHRRLCSMY